MAEQIKENRQKWLKVIKKNSGATRRELCNLSNTLYLWLQKNDSLWFEEHLPQPQKIYRKIDRLNWKNIDNELLEKVEAVSQEIRNERPLTRVSITEIIKRIGYKKWLDKRRFKLPKTARLLNEKLESLEDFMLRKLQKAERYYIARSKIPSRPQLIRKAVIYNSTSNNSSKIQKAIDEAITKIETNVMQKK